MVVVLPSMVNIKSDNAMYHSEPLVQKRVLKIYQKEIT